MNVTCKICLADNTDEIEALCLEAVEGRRSWRSVAAELGWSHHAPLKNHMEKHYTTSPSPTQLASEALDPLIADTIEELIAQWRLAPPEVKPFYAIAIQNLKGLTDTKPSQQNLVAALKAIHEVTGMKMEQRLMFEFAKHAFPGAAKKVELPQAPRPGALPAVIDAELVEEG